MKKIIKFTVLILLLGLVFIGGKAKAAIFISATGSWLETIDELDLQAGPGSDLIGTYESDSNAVSIDISGTGGDTDTWQVDVKKGDTNWHGDFALYVRRTSEGIGSGDIHGGYDYLLVNDFDESFFNGDNDRTDIFIQLKLSGVSIGIPPDAYTTTVYYTVVDI